MKIINNTAIQLELPISTSDRILSRIEKAEPTNSGVVFYWDYQESHIAAKTLDEEQPNQSLPNIPSPMLRDYAWPGIYKPFAHQKDTASFLSLRQRAFCFNEAGTGKTSAVLWAADYLMKLGYIKRVLVICPLSIMQSAWQADVFKSVMHRSCGIAHGSKSRREKVVNGDYEIVIINYDGIAVMWDEINTGDFDLIVVDEANAYKDASTQRWKKLAKLIKPTTWLWMMTGTPASQSPEGAFGLARLVSPERVPKFATAWRDKVMYQRSRFKWEPKLTAKQDVFTALQPAIRYNKADCIDLPSVVYQTRRVPMSAQAEKYYKQLKAQLMIEAAGETISAVNAAASLTKLLQVSGGAVYTDKRDVVEFDISPRLKALQEVLDETTQKVIVFVPYRHTIEVVNRYLTDNGVKNEVIDGSVSLTDRSRIFKSFQDTDNPRVLVIQPQAASHGVTLTAANTIVFWSPVLSVETYIQCVARIDRVGQVNKMTVVHLQGSDVESKAYARLQGKIDSHQSLIDLYNEELNEA